MKAQHLAYPRSCGGRLAPAEAGAPKVLRKKNLYSELIAVCVTYRNCCTFAAGPD
jgi:hypothetical protein